MGHISKADFLDFEKAINESTDDFHTKTIIWQRKLNKIAIFGEDPEVGVNSIPLKVLINYNYLRSWPITTFTETGELDRQSMQLIFNKSELLKNEYLNADGYLDYSPDFDRFIVDGLPHKPVGDTPVSESLSGDLFIAIIIRREEQQKNSDFR